MADVLPFDREELAQSLISGIEFKDTRLHEVLSILTADVYTAVRVLNPPTTRGFSPSGSQESDVSAPGDFNYTLFENNLRLNWDAVAGVNYYEIRYLFGSYTAADWDSANSILRTSSISADFNPITVPLIYGSHTFLLKAFGTSETGSDAQALIITIPMISGPVITPTVINNFVLLSWTAPTSVLRISHYRISKNGSVIGTVGGTFEAIFETTGGVYSYTVEAVDIVGNIGEPSPAAVLTVSNPVDFSLEDILTSTFSGTKTKCAVEVVEGIDQLLAIINITESWEDHFVNNSWDSPQEQIDAGYPIYIQPAFTSGGEYLEVFDFGTVFNNTIATVVWNRTDVVAGVDTSTTTLETSTDGATWSAPVTNTSIFAAALRYVRLKLKFTASSDLSLSYFKNLQCRLDVKREQDGGIISALAADAGGTTVTFNKSFKSIDSITVTAVSTTEVKAVYDFAFPVNPTTFKVLAFNPAGARVNADLTWIARGIL